MKETALSLTIPEIDRTDWLLVAALVGIWGLMAILINPTGDFPLNDDWAFGLPAKWLVEEGRLRFTDWQAHPLIIQVLWGGAFALPAGFSWTALRISTLTIAALGLGATYLSGREAGLSRTAAAAAACMLLINPIFVSLSNTFMTDVPCLALMLVSVALLLHGLRRERKAVLWAGWLVALLASLIRLVAPAIPLAMMVAVALKEGLGRRWLVRALLPAAMVLLGVLVVYPKVIRATVGLPGSYHARYGFMESLLGALLHFRLGAMKPLLRSFGSGTMYLGWWLLPLLLWNLPRLTGTTTARGFFTTLAAVCGAALIVTLVLCYCGTLMPLGDPGNIVYDFGTGLPSLAGELPHLPSWFWVAITAASAFGSVLIVLALGRIALQAVEQIRGTGGLRALWPTALLLFTAVISYLPLSLSYGAWFDRYMLPMLPFVAILIAGLPPSPAVGTSTVPSRVLRLALAWGLALAFLGFSVASTHDYLDWNRQRWTAGRDLNAREKVPTDEIEGGFEFYNLHAWSADWTRTGRPAAASLSEVNRAPRFVLSFRDLPRFKRVRRLAVHRWLPLSPDSVLVLERMDQAPVGETARDGAAPEAALAR